MANLAIDGNCAVALIEKGELVPGDPEIATEHKGHTYAFPAEEAREMFLAEPEKYAIAEDFEDHPEKYVRHPEA